LFVSVGVWLANLKHFLIGLLTVSVVFEYLANRHMARFDAIFAQFAGCFPQTFRRVRQHFLRIAAGRRVHDFQNLCAVVILERSLIAGLDKKPARMLGEASAVIEEVCGLKQSLPQVMKFLKKTVSDR
jgi:hypothetical protein